MRLRFRILTLQTSRRRDFIKLVHAKHSHLRHSVARDSGGLCSLRAIGGEAIRGNPQTSPPQLTIRR